MTSIIADVTASQAVTRPECRRASHAPATVEMQTSSTAVHVLPVTGPSAAATAPPQSAGTTVADTATSPNLSEHLTASWAAARSLGSP
ncbi:hypothetical protein Pth03_67850 [Planotetraspora thailandica]|uniref:Uncharacterized protein n=1 Tax=Planotetraspora thailandica TaxID=487172 RepID=A0A8J4DDH3_9ACTN|nr:hypothetical protein Pth03_67850 [Planotetraspora thailandica]